VDSNGGTSFADGCQLITNQPTSGDCKVDDYLDRHDSNAMDADDSFNLGLESDRILNLGLHGPAFHGVFEAGGELGSLGEILNDGWADLVATNKSLNEYCVS
jgi:hypothetical protein